MRRTTHSNHYPSREAGNNWLCRALLVYCLKVIPISSEDFDGEGNLLYSCANEREQFREVVEHGGFDATVAAETAWDALYKAVCRKQ